MAHLTGIGIENFRVFKDYTEFDFAPITILTGANNSGKSSVLKALLLLADNAKKNDLNELDFKIQGQQHNLGDWEFAKNNNNTDVNKIKFKIFYKTVLGTMPLSLKLQFGKDEFAANEIYYYNNNNQERLVFTGKNWKIESFDNISFISDLQRYYMGFPFQEDNSYFPEIYERVYEYLLSLTKVFSYLPPIRANTQRLYTYNSQGTGFNELLVQYLDSNFNNESKQKKFIDKWLKEFGLGDSIDFSKAHIKGVGTQIQIFKNGKELNLADLGFGVTQLIPLLMKIAICDTEYLLLEEPENSLHPNLQAKLADMFIDANRTFGINFIIETHSEYLIRKLQYLTAKKEITPEDTAIYYFYNPEQERPKDKKQVERIRIEEDGRLDQEFGSDFMDMSAKLIGEIWQVRRKN